MAPNVPKVSTVKGALPYLHDVIAQARSNLKAAAESDAPGTRFGFKSDLAVHFGSVSEQSIVDMQDSALVFLFVVVRNLEMEEETLDFGKTEDLLTDSQFADSTYFNNVLASESIPAQTDRADDSFATPADFAFTLTPSDDQLNNVLSFIKSTIQDKNVVRELQIDEEMVKHILVLASKHLSVLKSLPAEESRERKPIYHVVALRFPEEGQEYFKLYKLDITMQRNVSMEIANVFDRYSLNVQYFCTKICGLKTEIQEAMDESDITRVVGQAISYFGHTPPPRPTSTPTPDPSTGDITA